MLSFRRRFALAHLVVATLVLGTTAGVSYWTLARAVHAQLDAAVLALAETEVGMLQDSVGQPVRVHETPQGRTPFSFVRLDRLIQIVDARGEVLARSSNLGSARLPAPTELIRRVSLGESVFQTLSGFGDEPVRLVSVPAHAGKELLIVQVAGSLDDVNNVVGAAGVLFVVMGVTLVLALGGTGAVLTARVFGAIDAVVRQARNIGQTSLSRRLPHPGSQDEIGRLVDTLNDMLVRLEHAFETQRRFTADASHELRTPLSRLRVELDVALRRPRDHAHYEVTLRSCLDEVERLTLLVRELLVLARLDAGQERGLVETVNLNELARQCVERIAPLAHERQVSISLESASTTGAQTGVPSMLGLVLTNLLDNAVKYAPPDTSVEVTLHCDARETRISVADKGPGLTLEELPRVFDRFFRGAAARASDAEGVGLGLALSQAIVQANGGDIQASNRPQGGALFVVRLPARTAGEVG